MKSLHRKIIHWVAIAAIVMGALAPSISQAVYSAKGGEGFFMPICSADGSKAVQMIVVEDSDQEQSKLAKSCPYCLAHSAYVPVFNTTLSFSEPETISLFPRLFYQSPKPIFAWVSLPSRAPPAIS
jgi:hypothetical protein